MVLWTLAQRKQIFLFVGRANYTSGWFVHISWAKRRNEKEINWKSNEGYLRFCQLNLLVNCNNRRVLAGHLTIKTTLLKRLSAL